MQIDGAGVYIMLLAFYLYLHVSFSIVDYA